MTVAKHTPGPWKAVLQFGNWYVRQDPVNWSGGGYQHVCNLPAERKGNHYGDMFAANARLIAAAPQQHDALLAVLHAPSFNGLDEATKNAVRAAIAKATGSAA